MPMFDIIMNGVYDRQIEAVDSRQALYAANEMFADADNLEIKPSIKRLVNRNPLQPLYTDDQGTVRFKENAIVKFLLDAGPFDMNQLAMMPWTCNDREQFAQLIGYSLSGFGELSYVSDETYEAAEKETS